MTRALIVGSSVGAIVGLIHASRVYVRRASECPRKVTEHPVAVRARAAYFALWTFFLWVLFGSYVFYLWVVSVGIYAVYNGLKRLPNLVRAQVSLWN